MQTYVGDVEGIVSVLPSAILICGKLEHRSDIGIYPRMHVHVYALRQGYCVIAALIQAGTVSIQ